MRKHPVAGRRRAAPARRSAFFRRRQSPARARRPTAGVRRETLHVRDVIGLAQHDRGQMRGVNLHGVGRRQHGHRPCPASGRGQRRQPRRTGRARPAGKDADMAALVFMRIDRRNREIVQPKSRRVLESRGLELRNDRRRRCRYRRATISPHRSRPGKSRWPGFLRAKVTVTLGAKCLAENVAAVAGNAGRQIDGDNRQIAGRRQYRPPWRHRRTAAWTALRRKVHRPRSSRARPQTPASGRGSIGHSRGSERGIAVAASARRMPRRVVATPLPARMPGNDIAIAAIVAGAAQHMDAARRGIARQHHGSDRLAGAPHQADSRRAGRRRSPAGRPRPFRRETEVRCSWIADPHSIKHCPVFGSKQTGAVARSCGHIRSASAVAGADCPRNVRSAQLLCGRRKRQCVGFSSPCRIRMQRMTRICIPARRGIGNRVKPLRIRSNWHSSCLMEAQAGAHNPSFWQWRPLFT